MTAGTRASRSCNESDVHLANRNRPTSRFAGFKKQYEPGWGYAAENHVGRVVARTSCRRVTGLGGFGGSAYSSVEEREPEPELGSRV